MDIACTPVEEEFFRTGDQLEEAASSPGEPRTSIWRTLVDWVRGARTHPTE